MNEPNQIPTPEEIAKWVDSSLWETVRVTSGETNQHDFINYLSGLLILCEDSDGKRRETTIREALQIANDGPTSYLQPTKESTLAMLNRRGIHCKNDIVYFEKRNFNLLEMLTKKPQFSNYAGILKRFDEAEEVRVRMNRKQITAIAVPLSLFTEEPMQQTLSVNEENIMDDAGISW